MYETKNTHKISVLEVTKRRKDFPVLDQEIYGKPLVYFDNAATAQKPKIVIDIINKLLSENLKIFFYPKCGSTQYFL